MKQIISFLRSLEKKHGFRILFAVESGSREWGMSSPDSDYDVRGVYCYPPERYYDMRPYSENITEMKGDIDVHMMELRKYIRLLLNSNPTCIEWLESKTWYIGKQPPVLKRFLQRDWNPTALAHHYVGMAKQNYFKYLKTRHESTVKRYLYACRGWLAGTIALKGKLPPININELAKVAPITKQQRARLQALIQSKQKGTEKMRAPELPEFDRWLEQFMKSTIPKRPKKKINLEPYRKYVITTIRTVGRNV